MNYSMINEVGSIKLIMEIQRPIEYSYPVNINDADLFAHKSARHMRRISDYYKNAIDEVACDFKNDINVMLHDFVNELKDLKPHLEEFSHNLQQQRACMGKI